MSERDEKFNMNNPMRACLPNLMIVGAMKCGTTSLHEYLAKHPDIWMSNPKEIDFFSGRHSSDSLAWYKSHFNDAYSINGESSQNYAKRHHPLYKGAPIRMVEVIPEAKIIYVVRDPIDRYVSHIKENYFNEPAEDKRWNIENDHYVKTGLYHYQICAFLEHYPRSSLKVIDMHDLSNNRLSVLNGVFDFLGVERMDDASIFDFVANKHDSKNAPLSLKKNLLFRALNKFAPTPTRLILQSKMFRNTFLPNSRKIELSKHERESLIAKFKPDADKLRELLDRDFAHWSV